MQQPYYVMQNLLDLSRFLGVHIAYSYAVLGEGVAWLIGWSGYMQELLQQIGIHIPVWAQGAPGTGQGHRVNLIAAMISLAIAGLLTFGMEWGFKFKTPFVPIIPLIGICFSLYLIISLPEVTWIRFIIWMVIGLIIYMLYGKNKSNLAKI